MAVDPDAATLSLPAPGGDVGGVRSAGDQAATLAAGARVGRYTIERCIDRGGMGIVYEARDESLGRRVALKLLRADPSRAPWIAARLVREARTAAGLSHPNVVAVYEVGVHANGPFIAMEHVAGSTLRQWLTARSRTWLEIVQVFAEAGRGIAAAHAAGIVHRDIKPDNILVGMDRVRVADFGLARLAIDPGEPAPDGSPPPADAGDRITHAGTVLGTPRYMAPEQRDGREADVRSDQYSFCTSLAEALDGAAGVPARVRQAIARGRAEDPAARFDGMTDLLRELAREPRSRLRYALGGILVAAGAAASVVLLQGDEPQPCTDSARKLAGTWDDAVKARLAGTFRALDVGFGAETWRHVERKLDGYAGRWVEMHGETCRATRIDRDQSEDMLDRRMVCLDERKRALAALTASLAVADAKVAETAAAAADSLPRIADCGDLGKLSRTPPRAPDARIDEDLTAARLHLVAGKLIEARDLARRALEIARGAGDRARSAEALVVLGRIEFEEGDEALALAQLGEGEALAAEVNAPALRILAWDYLGRAYIKVGRLDEAAQVLELAFAALADAPDALAEADLRWIRGVLLLRRGKYAESRGDLERALALSIEVLGAEAEPLARIYNSLAIVHRRLGNLEEALGLARRRLDLARRLGDAHPLTAMARNAVGDMLTYLGRYDEAATEFEAAIVTLREAHGPRSEKLATVETSYGNMLARTGRWREATEHFRTAIEIKDALGADITGTLVTRANLGIAYVSIGQPIDGERVLREVLDARIRLFGAEHGDVAVTRRLLGRALARQGKYDEAAKELATALAGARNAFGPDHTRVAGVLTWAAEVERSRGRFAAAKRLDQQAAAIYEKKLAADHPDRAEVQLFLALDELGLGAHSRARGLAEAALSAFEKEGAKELAAQARFALARALWPDRKQRRRALELARRARDELAPTETGLELAAVKRWLAEHDVSGPQPRRQR